MHILKIFQSVKNICVRIRGFNANTVAMWWQNIQSTINGAGVRCIVMMSLLCSVNSFIPVMQPSHDLYLLTGDLLQLTCTVEYDNMNATSGPLKIRKLCEKELSSCNSHQVVNTEGRKSVTLIIPNVTVKDWGTYECSWNNSNKHTNYRIVKIGYHPQPPDVFCYSMNWLNMTCVVKLSPSDESNPLPTERSLYFSVDNGHVLPCMDWNKKQGVCNWFSSFDSDYVGDDRDLFQAIAKYHIIVTIRNIVKSVNFTYTIKPSNIVKLSKVESLRLERASSTEANVSWSLPDKFIPIFRIGCSVAYRSTWDEKAKQIYTENKGDMLISSMLRDLIPNTNYTVAVSCKPRQCVGDKYWSDLSTFTFTTQNDVPGVAPKSIPGGYHLPTDNLQKSIVVLLYLKPIPKILQHGEDLFYQVTLANLTGIHGNLRELSYRIRPSLTTRLELPTIYGNPFLFDITACNHQGCLQSNRSSILVPPLGARNTEYLSAHELTVESYNAERYLLSWTVREENIKNIIGYTCLWCKGDPNNRNCKSDLSWKYIPRHSNTSLPITVNASESNDWPWIFGVALVTSDKFSSGLSFAECIFFDHGKRKDPDRPTFNLLTKSNDNSQIIVSLKFTYCDSNFLRSKPEEYRVFYKDVTESQTEEPCIQDAQVKTVKATMDLREIIIDGLHRKAKYSVCMIIITRQGQSDPSEVQYVTTGNKDNTGEADDSRMLAGVIASSFVVIILIIIFVRYLYLKWSSIDDTIEDIVIPLKSNFNAGYPEISKNSSCDTDQDSGIHVQQSQFNHISSDSSGTQTSANYVGENVQEPLIEKQDDKHVSVTDSDLADAINNYVLSTIEPALQLPFEQCEQVFHMIPTLTQRQPFLPLQHIFDDSSDESDQDMSQSKSQYSSTHGLNSVLGSQESTDSWSNSSTEHSEEEHNERNSNDCQPANDSSQSFNPYLPHESAG